MKKKKWSKRERRKEREIFTICQGLSDSIWASPVAQQAKNPPGMQETQETQVQPLGRKDPPEEEMATHTSILASKIPWTEEPGRLQSIGSQRVGHG